MGHVVPVFALASAVTTLALLGLWGRNRARHAAFGRRFAEVMAGAPQISGARAAAWLREHGFAAAASAGPRDFAIARQFGRHPALCHVRPGGRFVFAYATRQRFDLRGLGDVVHAGFELRWCRGGLLAIAKPTVAHRLVRSPAQTLTVFHRIGEALLAMSSR